MELRLEWKKLQNGSDIRGVALDINPEEKVNLNPQVANTIAKAFTIWLSQVTGKESSSLSIAVGADSRLSGPAIKNSAISGISALGSSVSDCGIASTPAMFMSCVLPGFEFDGSIMITASHLPANRNGMKFFTGNGGLEKKDITEILNIAQSIEGKPDGSENAGNGIITEIDLISAYSDNLVKIIRESANSKINFKRPLEGLKIIVDAGNGAGGFFVDKVLKVLGADTTGSQFLEPDGRFPNHIPNPEDKTAMESIKSAVISNRADFGIIFDTDVDRAGAVDKYGREINRNSLIALMSAIVLEDYPGSTIVTDSITSAELKVFIEEKLGGIHHRFKRGYKNVINEAIRLNSFGIQSHLAIETSGHGALKENYFLDDGAYLIAKMLVKIAKLNEQGKTIDLLIEDLKEPLESMEFRLSINSENFKECGEKILSDLQNYASNELTWQIAPDNFEGVRVSFDDKNGNGWFLLRMSLHDPLMPLNIESNNSGGIREIGVKILEFLSAYECLETKTLRNFVSKIE